MTPRHELNGRSRWIVRAALVAYAATMILLLFLGSRAWAAGAAETVGFNETGRGGLFLATEDPDRLMIAPQVTARVDIDVSGPLARVTVAQTFTNPRDLWVEGLYTFPLPEKSAVDRLTMTVGERVTRGVIQQRDAAEATYRQAKAAGRRASLVSQERPNIFTTAVANIGPGETVTIEIEYQDTLRFDAGAFRLRFPMVVRPRYNPGQPATEVRPTGSGWAFDTTDVPDASRITPPIADPAGPAVNPLRLFVTLDAGFELAGIDSPSHRVDIERPDAGRALVALTDQWVPADRDFELVWRPAPGGEPTADLFTETRENDAYHLVMVMPTLADDAPGPALPREIVFILDKSGSMGGEAIRQAKAALGFALDRLAPDTRFNIIAYDNDAYPLFPAARTADPASLRAARRFLNGVDAGGGTEMAGALDLALDGAHDPGRLRQIVFVTDGAVGNEDALFAMISKRLGDSRLFTVGISSSPNAFFMAEAAEAGRGAYVYIARADEVAEKMSTLFAKITAPVLTDIQLAWPDGTPVETYPTKVPDLYRGEPVVVAARAPVGLAGRLTISGRRGGAPWSSGLAVGEASGSAGVAAIWARAKITDITRAARRDRDIPAEVTRQRIVDVALAHQLVSKHTSLVAVEDEIARPSEAVVASAGVPTNLPAGMDPAFAGRGVPGQASLQHTAPAAPPKVLRLKTSAAGTGQRVALPGTATDADLRLATGLLLLVIAGAGFIASRRLGGRVLA